MTEPIAVSFRYTEDQYATGVRLHLAKRFRWKIDAPIAVGVIGLGAFALVAGSGIAGPIIMGIGALYLCILAFGWFWLPVRYYRTQPKLRDEYRLVFSEEGVAFKTDHIDSTLAWSIYQRTLADSETYLLYYGKDAFTLLPRSVFRPGSADESNFRDLVRRKVASFEER
jgi:hypothetical protein